MGMQQKLDRAYKEGYEAGKKETAQFAEMRGAIKGATETWNLVEEMIPKLKGIGPKTEEKLLKAIQEFSREEQKRLKVR